MTFELAREQAGLNVDTTLIRPLKDDPPKDILPSIERSYELTRSCVSRASGVDHGGDADVAPPSLGTEPCPDKRVALGIAYVYRETVKLARQLKAIGDGDDAGGAAVDVSTSAPPIGLDPEVRS